MSSRHTDRAGFDATDEPTHGHDRFAAALDELRSRAFSDEELLDVAEQQLGLGAYVARRRS